MITRPSRAGNATQSAVSKSGAARSSVFWNENQLPKAPRQTSSKNAPGDLPRNSRNNENAAAASASAITGTSKASSARRSR